MLNLRAYILGDICSSLSLTPSSSYRGFCSCSCTACLWISVACSPQAQAHQWAAHVMMSSVSVTCHGLLQLSSLTVINTWPAHYSCTGCIHAGYAASASPRVGTGSRGITALPLCRWYSESYVPGCRHVPLDVYPWDISSSLLYALCMKTRITGRLPPKPFSASL